MGREGHVVRKKGKKKSMGKEPIAIFSAASPDFAQTLLTSLICSALRAGILENSLHER
jgi:hypothetical protein